MHMIIVYTVGHEICAFVVYESIVRFVDCIISSSPITFGYVFYLALFSRSQKNFMTYSFY